MRNLNVKNKLQLGFGIMIGFILLIFIPAVFGMRSMNEQNHTLVEKTLANTEYVWEIRRNLISEQRYMLIALVEEDRNESLKSLNQVKRDIERTDELMELYRKNYRIDKAKIDRLDAYREEARSHREKFLGLIEKETAQADMQAFRVYKEEYQPFLDEYADLLVEIGKDQSVLADRQVREEENLYRGFVVACVVLLLAALLISGQVIVRLLRDITTPLQELEDAALALSRGDFSVKITYDNKDEFGKTCNRMQQSFESLKGIIHEISSVMGEIGKGNLTVGISKEFSGEMKEIERSIGQLIATLNETFGEIRESAERIDEGANQVSSGSQALAQGATEQASSVEELSASLTKVARQVKTNSENAQKASVLATESGQVASETLENMNQLSEAMREITATSGEIQKVIKVIDDIAFQTNILALNAAVEAARAGSAGKGFAVVADEVRNLAAKSADAAKSTTVMIDSSIAAVARGEGAAKKTHDAFEELERKVNEVVITVNEISDASAEQADSVQRISDGVDQISSVVQTNSATSEESAAASEELSVQAGSLKTTLMQFKLAGRTYADKTYADRGYADKTDSEKIVPDNSYAAEPDGESAGSLKY